MPEIPDLEQMRDALIDRLRSVRIDTVETPKPIILRVPQRSSSGD